MRDVWTSKMLRRQMLVYTQFGCLSQPLNETLAALNLGSGSSEPLVSHATSEYLGAESFSREAAASHGYVQSSDTPKSLTEMSAVELHCGYWRFQEEQAGEFCCDVTEKKKLTVEKLSCWWWHLACFPFMCSKSWLRSKAELHFFWFFGRETRSQHLKKFSRCFSKDAGNLTKK